MGGFRIPDRRFPHTVIMKYVLHLLFSAILSATGLAHAECAYYSEESSPFGIENLVSGQFYAVHSATLLTDGQGNAVIDADSNIYVIHGVADLNGYTTVWLFGAGYGDPGSAQQMSDISGYVGPERDAYRSALADAQDVDCIITQEFSLSPEYVKLRFITPHGHLDHVNNEFLEALTSSLNYSLSSSQFMVHAADYPSLLCSAICCGTTPCNGANAFWGVPYEPPFSSAILNRFQTLGQAHIPGSCNVLMTFQSAMGQWQVRHESSTSHSAGILFLKHNNVAANVVTYITGVKQQFMTCPLTSAYPGTEIRIYDVHST